VFAEERTKLLRRDRFPDARQTMLYPEIGATYRRIEDPLNPDDSLQFTVALRAGVIEAASSRERFAQLEIGAQWLHLIGDSQALILRGDAATTSYGGRLESLAFPTSLRYFAGGDRSIRGYGYREVGPRFEGETLGGLHRIVASVEYQYFFTGEWGAAVFVDAGDAFNRRSAFDPKVGVGVGARWRSPVGLVGVDVAQGIDEAAGGGTRLHLSFGVGF
jgi:translocation and assembly module TamA